MLLFDLRAAGNRLLEHRKRMGLTQAEVAEAAGISDRTYADMERGTVNMRVETMLRICMALHITPDAIFTSQTEEPPTEQEEILFELSRAAEKERNTALRLLSVYLQSVK